MLILHTSHKLFGNTFKCSASSNFDIQPLHILAKKSFNYLRTMQYLILQL